LLSRIRDLSLPLRFITRTFATASIVPHPSSLKSHLQKCVRKRNTLAFGTAKTLLKLDMLIVLQEGCGHHHD
jgi:hypothetical protein